MMQHKFTPAEKVVKAIVDMQIEQPFFADLSMGLRIKPLPKDAPVPFRTMCVNAKGDLFFDEEYIDKLHPEQLKGVLTHECLHVAFSHISRISGRIVLLANIAQDVVVNHFVWRAGMTLPEGCIGEDYERGYDKCTVEMGEGKKVVIKDVSQKSWEEIYAELYAFADKNDMITKINVAISGEGDKGGDGQPGGKKGGPGQGDGKTGPGGMIDYHDYASADQMSDGEKTEQEEFWRQRMVDALTRSKTMGKVPGGMERMVEELLQPKVNWKDLLLRYVKQHTSPVDWSYTRPHRKSQVLGVYLPNVHRESNEVEVIVDTSGSIGREELTEFVSEIAGMARSMSHLQMYVSFVDAKLHERVKVDDDIAKIVALMPKGGGGTSMENGMDELKARGATAPVTIVLTDGYDSWNHSGHEYPFEVIWCINKNGISKEDADRKIPYGVKVKIE